MNHELLDLAPVMPIVAVDDVADAVPVARALLSGGDQGDRTDPARPVALSAIGRVASEVPDIIVGAGTVTTAEQARRVTDAGASFLASPGCTERPPEAASHTGLPFVPGVSTAPEAMRLAEHGFGALKFFPAEASGGIAYPKAIAGPLPSLRFCPTGGITPDNAREYLALPTVGCIGGSWLTPRDTLSAEDFARIEALARHVTTLR